MGKRTIRLDEEGEQTLVLLANEMGLSFSEVLRQGLLALRDKRRAMSARGFDVYQQLDLGPGGYALAPSAETRRGVWEALRRKR